jgi:Right handed beta helix region
MTRIASLLLAILLGPFLYAAPAQAQLVRTCVSLAKGSDNNSATSCHCTTPCRTFATAHAKTLPNGEITVLDPGDYGRLTITKSISINNDSGGEASITVSENTTGIIVNAPADAYVNLRGLTIQGVGFGSTTGLRFNTGFTLTVTDCVVRNHTGDGIALFPSANSNLAISNTLVGDNGGNGIFVEPNGPGVAKVSLSRVKVFNNSLNGVALFGASSGIIRAVVADSVAAGNSFGFLVDTGSSSPVSLLLVRSVAVDNNTGVFASGSLATVRVARSAVTGNTTASWGIAFGGTLSSYSDNNVNGNGDGDPAAPSGAIPKK